MMHKPFVYSRKKNYVHASSDDVDDSNDNRNVKMVIWTIIKNDGMINSIIFNWYENLMIIYIHVSSLYLIHLYF